MRYLAHTRQCVGQSTSEHTGNKGGRQDRATQWAMWWLKHWSKAEDGTLVVTLGNLKAETLFDMLADTPGEERAKTLKDTMAM